ncbi:MAG: STAS domain-containing protein, partial [Nitrospirales bacterium]
DFGARKNFKDILERLQQEGCPHVILNMEAVTFVDSSALGLLVISHQNLKIKQAQLTIVSPQAYVRQVLDLANVPKMIQVLSTIEEAKQLSHRSPAGVQ